MESKIPMVGRENELEVLMDHLAKALAGEGSLVLISGEAGSGKTTLCQEFGKLAIKSGSNLLVGRCVPNALSPFLPFMEAFHSQSPNPFVDDKEPITNNRGKLLLSVLESIERLSQRGVLILWLEDLHWADSASIALLHFLSRNVRTLRVLIIGTYRPEDIHAYPSGEKHPLHDDLRIMRREEILQELALQPLSPNDTKKIVPLKLGGIAERSLLDAVASESRGNPLFAVELIKYLYTSGQISERGGIWRLRVGREIQIPSTVREVILARFERVPQEFKGIMEYASAIGEWFDPELLVESIGTERPNVLDALQSLQNEYRLVEETDGRYKFPHEMIRQVVYEQISLIRRKHLHRSIGLNLEKMLPNEELLGQLSEHFDKANENDKCVKYSLLAGKYCLRKKSMSEVYSFLHLTLERTEGNSDYVAERLEALEGLGDMKVNQSTPKEWFSYYDQFLKLNYDRKARARVLAKAAECWDQMSLGDTKKAHELLDEAESLSQADPAILAVIEFHRGELCSNDLKGTEALFHFAKSERFYEEAGDPIGAIKAMSYQSTPLRQYNRMIEAKKVEEEALRLAKKYDDPELITENEWIYASICLDFGETELAKFYSSEAIQNASKFGMTFDLRIAHQVRGLAYEMEGDFESARSDLDEGLENARKYESPFHISRFELRLGRCELELGLADSAEHHFQEGFNHALALEAATRSVLNTDLEILRAELFAARGDFQNSEKIYDEMIGPSDDNRELLDMVEIHSRYGMSLARRGMLERARGQFDEAMNMAKRIGCEKRVQLLAKQVDIVVQVPDIPPPIQERNHDHLQ